MTADLFPTVAVYSSPWDHALHVAFTDGNGAMHEFLLSASGTWQHNDLLAMGGSPAGAAPAASTGSISSGTPARPSARTMWCTSTRTITSLTCNSHKDNLERGPT